MAQDIFAAYIQQLTGIAPAAQQESPAAAPAVSDDRLLNALKEISGKLDRFQAPAPVYYQPQVQPAAPAVPVAPLQQMDIAIINGQVVIPDNGVFATNVYIKDGKIAAIGNDRDIPAKKVIDAAGKYVMPGIVDPHVHMGLFVPMQEDLSYETKSAVMGGITTVGCFFGGPQSHFTSFPQIMEDIKHSSYTDVIPHLVIGNEEQRREMQDYAEHLGVTSFKIYMNGIPGMIPDVDDAFTLDVFDEIKKINKKCIVCVHAENRDLVKRATKQLKEANPNADIVDYSDTHPVMAEEEAVIRMSYLAEKSQVPVYFVHMTSKDAIDRLRSIRYKNKFVHVETTSMYLANTRQSAQGSNLFKMDPPFRDAEDVEELWRALEEGVIDTIGTDNTTIHSTEKNVASGSVWETIPGYPTEETHLASVLNEGVIKRGIPVEKLITRMTKTPAQTFGVFPQKGTILPGSDADVIVVDMNLSREVHAAQLHSRSDFSIYEGRKLQGWAITTIKGGQVLVEDGRFVGTAAGGKCLGR